MTEHMSSKTTLALLASAVAIANAKGLLKSLSKNATNATSVLDDMCSVIAYDLPSECQCQAGGNGQFEVQCQVDFMDVDEIGLTGSFAPCAQEAEAEFEVTESDLGIDWTKSYEAGEAEEFPIPGLTVGIPILGTAQVELAVELDGDASALTVSLGLDACIVSYFGTKCGSDLTSELPYYALNEQYDFSDYCQGGKKYGK